MAEAKLHIIGDIHQSEAHLEQQMVINCPKLAPSAARFGRDTGADLRLLAGVSVSRSHMTFYVRTGGGGGDTCVVLPTYG